MRIRHAAAADIPAMMTLEQSAATAAHWSDPQYRVGFSSEGPCRMVLLIEDAGLLQGFIVGRVLDREWEVENIVVAASARRRGLGTRLLVEFLDLARSRGARVVFLEVRESNRAARQLYEKCDFTESARRKGYYCGPDEDAIVFRLEFSPKVH